MKIGIFDSGKGGLSVFDEIKKTLPNEEYKYIADSKNCPYGEKSDEELWGIVDGVVSELKEWGAEVVVVACNTATTRCIEKLRVSYPGIEFVGTEPAIKLAINSGAENILVMATPGTISSERTLDLVRENKGMNQKIELLSCPGLADVIEFNGDIDKNLDELLSNNFLFDCVVLGCTHYSLIRERIQKYFPNARIVDGNRGVAERVKKIVSK